MLSQKDLNDVVLENAATTVLLCILAAKLLSEKVTKESLDESVKTFEKGLIDEWETDERETPEAEQFRKRMVASYAEIAKLSKKMNSRSSQVEPPEDPDPGTTSQLRGILSKLPYTVLADKTFDILKDLLTGDT